MQHLRTLALAALFLANVAAGGSAKISSGILTFQSGDYPAAIASIEEGLTDPKLKPARKAEAYAYLADAWYRLGIDPELAASHPDALSKSDEAIRAARALEPDVTVRKRLEEVEPGLGAATFNAGATAYNGGDKAAALGLFQISERYRDTYLTWVLIGLCHHQLGDLPAAREAFEKGIAAFGDTPRDQADPMLHAAYLLTAQLLVDEEPHEALALLAAGLLVFPDSAELTQLRLGILQREPELFEAARAEFDAHLKAHPDDVQVKLAYAVLLSGQGDDAEAAALLEQVLAATPDDLTANAYMAAHYIRTAAALDKERARATTPAVAKAAHAKVVAAMRAAYPHLEICNAQRPDEVEWVKQLIQVCEKVPERRAEAAGWRMKLKALQP